MKYKGTKQYSYTNSKTDEIVLFKGESTRVELKEKCELGYSIPSQILIVVKPFTFMQNVSS